MWKVHVPAGRWMAGVQAFRLKAGATSFMDQYNQTASLNGETLILWEREEGQAFRGRLTKMVQQPKVSPNH
jgi:hypothetical protein